MSQSALLARLKVEDWKIGVLLPAVVAMAT
jgi:hypothetical protein